MRNLFKYLLKYSTQPTEVDRLIVSAFLHCNKLVVKRNSLLKSFVIQKNEINEYDTLHEFISIINQGVPALGFEELIELFEFVISPSDRIVNGAVYTPLHIRDYIVTKSLSRREEILDRAKVADISCGCGGFLYSAAIQLHNLTGRTYADIFRTQIFGLDIQPYSVTRTKLLLSLLALTAGEDRKDFHFNLFQGDALTFNWNTQLNNFSGFDIILGNPPYVCARNLSEEVKQNLLEWEVCKSGNPDLYIPFFQIGIENLNEDGVLGFITMNTFFKSLNGRALREYFKQKNISFKIIDFGTEQVFKSKNTYTCICIIENRASTFISYYRNTGTEIPTRIQYSRVGYNRLDSKKGWNLQDNEIISRIESTGASFGKLYKTRHGIATLKNEIYIFKPAFEDRDYYYLQNGSLFPIEKGICNEIVNTNKLSRAITLNDLKEQVLFPYDDNRKLLSEKFIREQYPYAYDYLKHKKNALAKRDKGKGNYENWFAFGRTQSLEKVGNKLFFPKMSDRTPEYLISDDEDLLFYNGQAIIGHTDEEMLVIKKIMQSRLFWYYIKTTSKPYSSSYFSLNGNYINNFGICPMTDDDISFVIEEQNKNTLDEFFEDKYGITLNGLTI